ncbi:hypothetical protein [Vibrio breoganii]|uniref:hypothetical protein n=1 Tax=Vibrio breoganii TaxID=553239 RepID=UPI000C8643BA|nr:hypothetical protein [Vibrio breoganii]PMM20306.1 hypothetical protein BCT59_07710 [Vibrio breoganii]
MRNVTNAYNMPHHSPDEHDGYYAPSNTAMTLAQDDYSTPLPTIDMSTSSPVVEDEGMTWAPYSPVDPEFTIANNDGTTTNVVTGETDVIPNAKDDTELSEAIERDDVDEYTNQFLTKIGAQKSAYDYDLKEQKHGYMPALSSFAVTALGAYLAKERGASDKQIGTMLTTSMISGGKQIQDIQDRIGRQKHIDALEAKGYLHEDIDAWLKSGDSKDLTAQAKAKGALAAQSRQNKTGYYAKGDTLPDGSKATREGQYEITYTNTLAGVPQVANIHFAGNETALKHDQQIERIRLQHELAQQRNDENQWVAHSHDGRSYKFNKVTGEMKLVDESGATYKENKTAEKDAEKEAKSQQQTQSLVTAIEKALVSGDAASGDHVGPTDQFIPDLAGDTQTAAGDFERVKELLTVENLELMSGTLTDKDIQVLRSAATSLDAGRYWDVNRTELVRILNDVKAKLNGNTTTPATSTTTTTEDPLGIR